MASANRLAATWNNNPFLLRVQSELGFEARKFQPTGFETKEDFVKQHGVDLYMTDVEEYDRICKVCSSALTVTMNTCCHC